MPMTPFHVLFPREAKKEYRTLTPFRHGSLPYRAFLFMELFCDEPGCDCRRVLLNVFDAERRKHVATINHAFEPPELPFEDEGQTYLDPLNPQSSMSEALLDLFKTMVASDEGYRQRLERHYLMWKRVVDDATHPDHVKVHSALHDDPSFKPAFPSKKPIREDGSWIGPNDPCPCGSGKKLKRCCRR